MTPVPPATVARLPIYLRALDELVGRGTPRTSSGELAALAGVGPAQLRRDLSYLGSHGVRGVGYEVAHLRAQVAAALGLTRDLAVVIVGVGNLGQAFATYVQDYEADGGQGFRVAALLDAAPDVVGTRVGHLVVEPAASLEDVVAREGATVAVLATPAGVAQEVADRLVTAGVRSILTFAARVLRVPDGVDVRSVDLARELQILAFHQQTRSATT
ncbi:REX family transcriptional regulator [Actinotalea ferrariae CF5-4]|uniref:Redox-sensing transcriptional repressor Rex n=1 Tax=Actinotalea ferrariae CF5-4 TaxID=948458 RepID=A0A021VP22_9CELL|nr:redox-sensing transcriptional repressor Rex [Actinotalea ferrariae]EYR62848.1 REX family transcriptional regulator [Actinotalea ferrariae CF5-4]